MMGTFTCHQQTRSGACRRESGCEERPRRVLEARGDLPALEAAVRRLADGGERARLAARAAAAGARFDPAACAAAYADVLLGVAR